MSDHQDLISLDRDDFVRRLTEISARLAAHEERLTSVERDLFDLKKDTKLVQGEVGCLHGIVSGVAAQMRAIEQSLDGVTRLLQDLAQRFDAHLLDTRTAAIEAAEQARAEMQSRAEDVARRIEQHERLVRWISWIAVILGLLTAVSFGIVDGESLWQVILKAVGM